MQLADFAHILAQHTQSIPDSIALQGSTGALTYAQLQVQVTTLSLPKSSTPIAYAVCNHPAWVVFDLAALFAGIPLVPLPFYFTDSQLLHAVLDAGAEKLITDQPQRFSALLGDFIVSKSTLQVAGKLLMQYDLRVPHKPLPENTAKITYTSGTTGKPKGVCLGAETMLSVAQSIVSAAELSSDDQHLCALPLPTLLENVAGVYATLLAGGCVHVLPTETTGFSGTQLDAARFCEALEHSQANTVILIPALLAALVLALEVGAAKLPHLRFVAVGGAHVPRDLLERAKALDLSVFEGYGLSECASAVSLNTPVANRIGSVGKPLPHLQIKLADDHEIMVKGTSYLGYTNEAARKPHEWLATGDIGEIDRDGFLHIRGRKKNMFITAFGRNVTPEWVESALQNAPDIAQACVFGEAKPYNIALIVLNDSVVLNAPEANIHASIGAINQTLPDYARVSKFLIVPPFSLKNGQLTANGRLKRDAILSAYQDKINNLYEEKV